MNDEIMSEKELMALERVQMELEQAEAEKAEKAAAPPPLRPTEVPVIVEWEDAARKTHREVVNIRVLNFDEEVRVGLMCARLARGAFNELPIDDAIFIKALATCGVMWPDKMKGPFGKLLHEDRETTVALFNEIAEHRDARFRGDGGPGSRRKATVRLVSDPSGASK